MALHVACEVSDCDFIILLLMHGAKPNCMNNDGFSPLHIACKAGQLECVETLLAASADVHLQSDVCARCYLFKLL